MPGPYQRILVRGVNWLGDAVMTTPALQRLREAQPAAQITLLTPAKLADIWANHPAINAIETFQPEESAFGIGRRLREGNFDIALVLPNSPRSALETWLARIPERVGYARPWRNWLLSQAIAAGSGEVKTRKRSIGEIKRLIRPDSRGPADRPAATAHQMHHYLRLSAALGANIVPLPPKLTVASEAEARFAAKVGQGSGRAGEPWFGLNPGAEYGPAKRWPEERFIEVAAQVHSRVRCRWLIFGLASDSEMAGRIAAGIERAEAGSGAGTPRAVNLAGATSLGELCAGLKLCRMLLTNDSGPMHVAVALGTPVVALFGSTSPELTGPGLPGDPVHQVLRGDAACAPCFRRECPIDFRCMTGIETGDVVEAVLRAARC